jgi:hypothetical protein
LTGGPELESGHSREGRNPVVGLKWEKVHRSTTLTGLLDKILDREDSKCFLFDDAPSLLDCDESVDRNPLQDFVGTPEPLHLKPIHLLGLT